MARKPKTEPVADAQAPAPAPEVFDDFPGPVVALAMSVVYRDDRHHNGQNDLAAIVTAVHGDDAGGRPIVALAVFPPGGTPFNATAKQWDGSGEQPERTWRYA